MNKFTPLRSTLWLNEIVHEEESAKLRHPEYIGVVHKCCTGNWWLYKIYSASRFFYVTFWFYFSPFFFSTLQFIIPLIVLYKNGVLPGNAIEE